MKTRELCRKALTYIVAGDVMITADILHELRLRGRKELAKALAQLEYRNVGN